MDRDPGSPNRREGAGRNAPGPRRPRLGGDAFITSFKSDVSGTIRGRAGMALNNTLLYATGGVAWADTTLSGAGANAHTGLPTNEFANRSETVWGAVIGVGAEYALSPNWSVGAEFLHTAYQHSNVSLVHASGLSICGTGVIQSSSCTSSSQLTTDVARIRVNYKFGWGAPLVAKY